MSPDAEQPRSSDPAEAQVLDRPHVQRGAHTEHHLLRESVEDRWAWRAKIRRNPYQLRAYRVAVAFAGLFFVALGFVSGPLPGPGGIPLVLLGLAIWSSEFVWAQHVMAWFKVQLHRFRSWSRAKQTVAWVVFFACCGVFGYGYLILLGAPAWMPARAEDLLAKLPGI
jgi:uncharacterized protein (TIGR02611 family)